MPSGLKMIHISTMVKYCKILKARIILIKIFHNLDFKGKGMLLYKDKRRIVEAWFLNNQSFGYGRIITTDSVIIG